MGGKNTPWRQHIITGHTLPKGTVRRRPEELRRYSLNHKLDQEPSHYEETMVTMATLLLVTEVVTSRQHSVQEFIRHPLLSEVVKTMQPSSKDSVSTECFSKSRTWSQDWSTSSRAHASGHTWQTADAKEPYGRFHGLLLEKQART